MMTDRRAELEKKKLKLQQLRELKELRRLEKENRVSITDIGGGTNSGITGNTGNNTLSSTLSSLNTTTSYGSKISNITGSNSDSLIRSNISEVDDILESVGISTSKGALGSSNYSSINSNRLNDNHSGTSSMLNSGVGSSSISSMSTMTSMTNNNNSSTIVDNNNSTTTNCNDSIGTVVRQQLEQLSIATFPQVLIAPKENVTYEKQTQTQTTATGPVTAANQSNNNLAATTTTTTTSQSNDRGPLDYYVLTYDDIGGEEDGENGSLGFPVPPYHQNNSSTSHHQNPNPNSQHHHQQQHQSATQQQQNPHQKRPSLPHVEMVRPAQTEDDQVPGSGDPNDSSHHYHHKPPKRQEYKEEERRHLMLTETFRKFIDRAVRITERALACTDSMDIFVDYTGQVECVDSEEKSGLRLSLNTTFMDERWSRGRTVTSFDWCTEFPELLVASYNQNDEAPNEPDGICLVWNMKFKKTTPEYVFHCQSPVMSASFAKFHPNLILGGTYSGQIVLWDNRSGKRVPVQRSPLSASAHTHPVYCLKVVGTQNSHNLISISNDGKLCSWSLDMLSAPQETMELCQQKQSRSIAVTSMSFPVADYNNFVLGSQEGSVYSACRHGAKAGILDVYEGHQGPVTAIDFHQASSSLVDFSHLYLTASFDWTFKLWSMRETKPLYSFEDGNDYLYDIRWSPIHPALFATVDGLGRLDIWNLNNDTELPTVSTVVEGNPALNRLIWSPNGQQLVVGDDAGKIWIYDVGEQLAFPKNDEWSRFAHTLQEFTNNSIEI